MKALFNWMRREAEAAILDGVADAAEKLTTDGKPIPPRLAALLATVTTPPALPPAADPAEGDGEDDKPAKKRGRQ